MGKKENDFEDEDAPIANPEFALEKFFLSILIGLGSWLGGRTGQAIWDKGSDVFSNDNNDPDDGKDIEVRVE